MKIVPSFFREDLISSRTWTSSLKYAKTSKIAIMSNVSGRNGRFKAEQFISLSIPRSRAWFSAVNE